jgi:hypothetical protein
LNVEELQRVRLGDVTEIGPVVAPLGTVAWISESESSVKFVVSPPLNPTKVAPVKSVSRMSIVVPLARPWVCTS